MTLQRFTYLTNTRMKSDWWFNDQYVSIKMETIQLVDRSIGPRLVWTFDERISASFHHNFRAGQILVDEQLSDFVLAYTSWQVSYVQLADGKGKAFAIHYRCWNADFSSCVKIIVTDVFFQFVTFPHNLTTMTILHC